jgi:hypothetical protein
MCPASLCPVLPIGAENLPGKITAQGSAVAEQRTRRRRALDCDLARRDDARHGGRATRGFAWCGAGCSVSAGHHRPGGSGDGRPASAAAPGSVRPREGAASADAPGHGQTPAFPRRRHRPGGAARLSSRFPSRPARALLRCSRAGVRRLACRRRALDERLVLVLANWTYAGTGYTPRTPAAELALTSADMARAR